jgi:hypothetical protein
MNGNYSVTFNESKAELRDPDKVKRLELADAVTHAFQLIDQDQANVTIHDGNGNSIFGSDLLACWRGEKEITPDLKAV